MTLFSSTQPSLRARVLPRFPANVVAGNGISIEKSGNRYIFSTTAGRTRLDADLDLYVATTGSDSADGAVGTPFRTIQHAVDIASGYDFDGHAITIHVAAGTYNEDVFLGTPPVGTTTGNLLILGDRTTPSNVVVNCTEFCFFAYGFGNSATINGFKFASPTGTALWAQAGAVIYYMDCEFGACPNGYHTLSVNFGSCQWQQNGTNRISGGAIAHIAAFIGEAGGSALSNIVISNTPNFSDAFVVSEGALIDLENITFSGTVATGIKFRALSNSQITPTLGSGLTYLPGDIAGYCDGTSAYGFFRDISSKGLGTISSGTIAALDITDSTMPVVRQWYYINNGAHTLTAPAVDGELKILVTNGASAGVITFSGFTVKASPGDALNTTNGNKFLIEIFRINSISTYRVYALQ